MTRYYMVSERGGMEFPLLVTDSLKEAAEYMGITFKSLLWYMCKKRYVIARKYEIHAYEDRGGEE